MGVAFVVEMGVTFVAEVGVAFVVEVVFAFCGIGEGISSVLEFTIVVGL